MSTSEDFGAEARRDEAIPKDQWGPGPWQSEPDRIDWYDEATGYPCLLLRNMQVSGSWCGYVAVPPGHPVHGKKWNDEPVSGLDVHGGVTHTGLCRGEICHVPRPGEPDDVFWIGFDSAHCFDIMPAVRARLREIDFGRHEQSMAKLDEQIAASEKALGFVDIYRTAAYMQQECRGLAAQLKAMEPK